LRRNDVAVKKRRSDSTKPPEGHFQPKHAKLWVVGYGRVRRHSRLLYIGLDPEVVRLHDIQLGDTIKFSLMELIKAPRNEDEERLKTNRKKVVALDEETG